jgi:cystathionine gamma-synthase
VTGFDTRAIRAGGAADPLTGAVVPPIHLSTTFRQDFPGELLAGFEYGRCANPTRSALQENLAALEGGLAAYSFASGMAAEDAFLRAVVRPGDHIVLGLDAYGGSYRMINSVYGSMGVTHTTTDLSDLTTLEAVLSATPTRVVRVETPSNPVMGIVDIAAVSEISHRYGAIVLVDNTFATPALQRPFELGADVIVHSTTKYLGGHSDVLGGAVILNNDELAASVYNMQNWLGAVSSPFDCYLTLRGIKTLGVRMERHSRNALALAQAVRAHPVVENVFYPGLETHPGHAVAERQMSAFGGMLSLTLANGPEAAKLLTTRTELFTLAPSLGGVESLIEWPSGMTHTSVEGTALAVPHNLVRIAVGIETESDLIDDLTQALDSL